MTRTTYWTPPTSRNLAEARRRVFRSVHATVVQTTTVVRTASVQLDDADFVAEAPAVPAETVARRLWDRLVFRSLILPNGHRVRVPRLPRSRPWHLA